MERTYRIVNAGAVQVTDPLFSHYVSMISEVVLPYQWEILNDRVEGATKSHCLENFRIASGEKQGAFYGQVFQDSDVYKWLEAVAYCIQQGKALQFIPIADEVISLIGRAQQKDGYLHTYHIVNGMERRWSNLVEAHELYCAGYLIEAAMAYHEATGKRRLLSVAIAFADLICNTFGPGEGQLHGYPGHEEIELALIKLFRHTKDARYMDTARYFLEARGSEPNYFLQEIAQRNGESHYHEFRAYDLHYAQAHVRPVEQRTVEGHAVRALYLYSAMADYATDAHDTAFADACTALWDNLEEKRMYITGGVGSSGFLERFTTDYDLPNERAYCESCASVALMMFGKRMAALSKEARYYEGVERALYNTVLAGIHHDGLHYFYVNPLEVWPSACMASSSMAHVQPVRQKWFEVACCPTNIARTLASLGQYIYSSDERGILVNQFISSRLEVAHHDETIHLTMVVEPTRRSLVTLTSDGNLELGIRLPSYTSAVVFKVDGVVRHLKEEHGYALVTLEKGSVLSFDLALQPTWMAAHPEVRADSHKVALTYGPFVYCLEEMDNSANLGGLGVAIAPRPAVVGSLDTLPGSLPILGYEGFRLDTQNDGRLYAPAKFMQRAEPLQAVPYCLWGNRKPGEMVVFQHLCRI
ncbi:glycoside hydrolase family 127 protein [Sphaerochaeta sp. PS]|uniref:glycoside hydrolase family 127 protein n=1 Tax=Sphaerochaeta sp. PS TaxID=3076336 RepID=UPI0028A3DBDD|nr:beta-L-arabinofuranosidase domain-containing protein [Sphaerochaeta sp. PS]MDT4762885.1 glycoside hydrolase family 127 protein [Sphaerochaeta sp. PS]